MFKIFNSGYEHELKIATFRSASTIMNIQHFLSEKKRKTSYTAVTGSTDIYGVIFSFNKTLTS